MQDRFSESAACLLLCVALATQAQATGLRVIDEGDGEFFYLTASTANTLLNGFPPPPAPGSEKDRYDMLEVLSRQTGRTDQECAAALSQESATLTQLFSENAYPFEGKPPEVMGFFRRVGSDARLVCHRIKNRFKRPRPTGPGMVYCALKVGNSYSYPCLYTTTAFLFAELLSQLNPDERIAYLRAATQAGQYRVIAGTNRRSDLDGGKDLAKRLYLEFSKNKNFRKELESLRKYLKKTKKR